MGKNPTIEIGEQPPHPDDLEGLRALVDKYSWHHQIDLGHGITTPGRDRSAKKLDGLQLPPLTGKSVLDVGAWDGYFSFAAERMGAARVVALDSFVWQNFSKEPFELARRTLGSRIEDVELEVHEIAPATVGKFDVVFFLGVLYHMRDPMSALESVSSVTDELLVMETLTDMNFTKRPAAAFYPGSDFVGDETNWWGPNTAAVVGMLKEFGFNDVRIMGRRGPLQRLHTAGHNLVHAVRSRLSSSAVKLPFSYAASDRLIVQARR